MRLIQKRAMKILSSALSIAIFALATEVYAITRYVDLNNANPSAPFTNWITAATNIQDAIDVAGANDEVVVANGVYQSGARVIYGSISNRVAINKPITVRSVNGPLVTVIRGFSENGDRAVRCVYLTNGSALVGFTLTEGSTRIVGDQQKERNGGGAWSETESSVLSNCVFLLNKAWQWGGGAYGGTLQNCNVASNSVDLGDGGAGGGACASVLWNCVLKSNYCAVGGAVANCTVNNSLLISNLAAYGGGAASSSLNYCTLAGNIAVSGGGGAFGYCDLSNCISYYNSAAFSENYYYLVSLNHCNTFPMPNDGAGNFTNQPLFIDVINGNLRLRTNSPCINAGNPSPFPGTIDLDGRPRVVGGQVDVGAYEFQGAGIGEFIGWLQNYGLATDGSADFTDADSDGMNNWSEWRADTNPTDFASALRMQSAIKTPAGTQVSWQSVPTRTYFLERAEQIGNGIMFQSCASNILGVAGDLIYIDSTAANGPSYFYRVGIQ
jgi:hypothetical protein